MPSPAAGKDRPPFTLLLAIALLSTTALSFEILLMRLLSIIQWHHFAYMIISLALLGYGASGSFLALCSRWLAARFLPAFVVSAVLFGLSMPICFAIAQQLPFNPLELLWDGRQQRTLLLTCLLFTLPFFCAANCVGLAFIRYRHSIGQLYRTDMLGAGVGQWRLFCCCSLCRLRDTCCCLPRSRCSRQHWRYGTHYHSRVRYHSRAGRQ